MPKSLGEVFAERWRSPTDDTTIELDAKVCRAGYGRSKGLGHPHSGEECGYVGREERLSDNPARSREMI